MASSSACLNMVRCCPWNNPLFFIDAALPGVARALDEIAFPMRTKNRPVKFKRSHHGCRHIGNDAAAVLAPRRVTSGVPWSD